MKKLLLFISIIFLGTNKHFAQTALDFDGNNQWVEMGAIPSLSNFTIEFDIRHNGTDAGYDRFVGNTNNGLCLATDGSGNVKVYSNNIGINWTLIGYTMATGTWQHMAWVYDGTNFSLYVNGSYVNQLGTNLGSLVAASWFIAANEGNFSENANVSIDNFRLWDDARTPTEIADNYQTCLTGLESNLIVLYDFEDGSGITLSDLAGSDNDGTLINSPVWGTGVTCNSPIPDLVITEIMYNGPESGTDTTEFIEIYNNDVFAVDLTNYALVGGAYTFPNDTLNPGEFYVVAVNSTTFNNVFGFMPDGVFTNGLSNGGEFITLKDNFGNLVDSVFYDDVAPWPSGFAAGEPDGGGSSLILCDVNSDNNDGNNWNACATQTGVIINTFEVLASPGVANVCCSNTTSTVNTSVCSGSNYTYADGTTANNITADVSYVSTIPNASGCDSLVTENITVISIADQTVVATETVLCASNTGTTITTGSSENGVKYYLRNDADNSVVDGPIEGTGLSLSFGTGTISNTSTYNVFSENLVLDAVSLPATNDYVRFNSPFTTYGNAITVEAWVYSDGAQFPWAGQGTAEVDNMTVNVWLWHAGTWFVNDNGNWRSLNWPALSAGWVHVSTVADASGMYIYYDGVLVASNTSGITSNIRNNASSIIDLGQDSRFPSNSGRNSNTGFDNFSVWNIARPIVDIAASYNNCLTGTETGLVQYTKFNEGTGTTIVSVVGTAADVINPTTNWMEGSNVCTPLICSTEMTQTITVTVLPALTGNDNTTICADENLVINGTTYNASNPTGTEVFTNVGVNGCDSTVTVALNVLAAVDATVDNTLMPTLSANQAGATYRWLDCDNGNAVIPSETGQTYTATVNGNYAVEVTFNGCVDTSACENITGVGVKEIANNTVSIYPNPTNGIVNINLGSNNTSVNYSIVSIEGRVVETGKTLTNNIIVDLSKEGNGVYFIRISTESTSTVYKLIKQ